MVIAMKKFEFSKLIMVVAILMWIAGGAFGAVIVHDAPDQLTGYLAYLGGPVGVAYGFYAWKSKAENVIKLTKDIEKDKKLPNVTKQQLTKAMAKVLNNMDMEDFGDGT